MDRCSCPWFHSLGAGAASSVLSKGPDVGAISVLKTMMSSASINVYKNRTFSYKVLCFFFFNSPLGQWESLEWLPISAQIGCQAPKVWFHLHKRSRSKRKVAALLRAFRELGEFPWKGGLCHREHGGLEMKKMRLRGKLLKMGVIREPQKQGSPGQPSLGTVDSWESLEAEWESLPIPRALHSEPNPPRHKNLGERRGEHFLHFQITVFSVAEASLHGKLLLPEPYLPSRKPIRHLQPPSASCLTKEKRLKYILRLQSRDSGLLKCIPPTHKT